jgi:hypothetical protein
MTSARYHLFMHRRATLFYRFTAATVLPYDWLGIGLARLAGARIRTMHGLTLAYGGKLNTWLAHHPLGAMDAVTLGHVVLASNAPVLYRTLTHEFEHVRQFQRWGLIFPLAYLVASLWSFARGRGLYWGNVFEVAARKTESLANSQDSGLEQ